MNLAEIMIYFFIIDKAFGANVTVIFAIFPVHETLLSAVNNSFRVHDKHINNKIRISFSIFKLNKKSLKTSREVDKPIFKSITNVCNMNFIIQILS